MWRAGVQYIDGRQWLGHGAVNRLLASWGLGFWSSLQGHIRTGQAVKHGSESRVHLAGCVKADDWKAGRAWQGAGSCGPHVSPTHVLHKERLKFGWEHNWWYRYIRHSQTSVVDICWLLIIPIGSMYAIYGNIYHQYTPNVSIYTIHGSYGYLLIIDIFVDYWLLSDINITYCYCYNNQYYYWLL
jgi:hypothetical protein